MASFTKKDVEILYAQPQRRENIRFVLSALENITYSRKGRRRNYCVSYKATHRKQRSPAPENKKKGL